MTAWGKFATGKSGAASVDWLVMSAAAIALAATAGALVNAGVVDFVAGKLAQIIADAVDEVGNDATDRN